MGNHSNQKIKIKRITDEDMSNEQHKSVSWLTFTIVNLPMMTLLDFQRGTVLNNEANVAK